MSAAKVLVVDDDEDIRSLLRVLLERAGAVVFEAPDGRDGLREFHAHRPDLVILDVSMPEIDGWQMLDRIRDMSDVPVLMLTARADELERVRGLHAGGGDQVKLYIGYLRRKLDPDSPDSVPIETVRGFGYRYSAPAAS